MGGPEARLLAMIDQCLPYPGHLQRDWVLWVELWLRTVRYPELQPTAARLYEPMRDWFTEGIEALLHIARLKLAAARTGHPG